ncbi:MAG: hypothetical protein AAF485_17425 [Chloroflexota bacterium]
MSDTKPDVVTTRKPRRSRIKGKWRPYTKSEKIAWLANGFIWTLVVWTTLIFLLLSEDNQVVLIWLTGSEALAAPQPTSIILTEPTAFPVPTETATKVLAEPSPTPKSSATPTPTVTPALGSALLIEPPIATPKSAEPTVAQVQSSPTPNYPQAEVAAISFTEAYRTTSPSNASVAPPVELPIAPTLSATQ